MGQRLRLKARVTIDDLPRQARVIATRAQALRDDRRRQRLALVHPGAPDARWDNDDLRALKRLKGSDFEVVSEGPPA